MLRVAGHILNRVAQGVVTPVVMATGVRPVVSREFTAIVRIVMTVVMVVIVRVVIKAVLTGLARVVVMVQTVVTTPAMTGHFVPAIIHRAMAILVVVVLAMGLVSLVKLTAILLVKAHIVCVIPVTEVVRLVTGTATGLAMAVILLVMALVTVGAIRAVLLATGLVMMNVILV